MVQARLHSRNPTADTGAPMTTTDSNGTTAGVSANRTQYMLLIYDDETQWQRMSEAEAGKVFAEYMEYTRALAEAGLLRAGAPLHPTPTATTVRVRDGRTLTTD